MDTEYGNPYLDPANRNVKDGSVDYYEMEWEEIVPYAEETIFSGCPQGREAPWPCPPCVSAETENCFDSAPQENSDHQEYEILET